MAKGNRTINLYEDDIWKNVFYNSVGTYVNVINLELSQEYPLEPLSDYIKIGGGYAFKTSEYKKRGVPIIRISDFNNEQIDLSNCVYYDENEALSKYELNENDIIICLTGGTIAKLGIVQSGLGKLYMNQRVGRFDILDGSKFEKEYVYWIARSVQSIIKNLAWGAAIPNVSPKQIEKLQFSFPPINVQQQIIEFLNDLKNNAIQRKVYFNENIERHIIELQNNNVALKDVNSELTHQLDLIKQLRQAFLREAMQGKLVRSSELGVGSETGHKLLAKIKAEKAQLIAEKKLKKEKELALISEEEIPFEIPEHWAWCRLEEIFSVEKGLVGIQKAIEGEFPLVVTGEQRLTHNEFHFEGKAVIVPTVSSTGHGHASLKRIHYQEGKFAVGNILACIMPLIPEYFNMKFIYNYLDTYKEFFFVEKMKGAANVSLKISSIKETPIPCIPIEIQNKYEELIEFCDGLEQSIKESQGYNEKLLQQVLREALQGS